MKTALFPQILKRRILAAVIFLTIGFSLVYFYGN